MDKEKINSIRENLELKSDQELIEIWKKNNKDEWQDGVFDIIEGILINRGKKLPGINTDPDLEKVKFYIEQRSDQELLEIFEEKNNEEWRDEVFDIVSEILKNRGILQEKVKIELDLNSIKENMLNKSDQELLDILGKNNSDDWQVEVFDIVKDILLSRGRKLPERKKNVNNRYEIKKNKRNKKYYGIKGWLLLFCSIQVFFIPILSFLTILAGFELANRLSRYLDSFNSIYIIHVLIASAVIIYGFYIGIILIMKKEYAVRAAKRFLMINFIFSAILNIYPFFLDFPPYVKNYIGKNLGIYIIGPLFYWILWSNYFNFSKRVKATFGSIQREEDKENIEY